MEVTRSLLVALMYITILTLGIANILTSLADMVRHARTGSEEQTVDWLHTSWVLIMLLTHFNLFWHTLGILDKETWEFEDFLFAVSGPILMFFATQVVIGATTPAGAARLRDRYFALARRFFSLYATVQVWVICVDLMLLGRGFTGAAVVNVLSLAIGVTLLVSTSARVHVGGTLAAWAVMLVASVLRSVEMIV